MCLQLGIDDPEAWLETVDPGVLACWEAYDTIEPIGCDWERHASVMAMLEAVYAACINPHLGKDAKPVKPRGPQAFLPDGFADKPKRKPRLIDQLALFGKVFGGVKNGNHNQ